VSFLWFNEFLLCQNFVWLDKTALIIVATAIIIVSATRVIAQYVAIT
jgi:hypothetical protein